MPKKLASTTWVLLVLFCVAVLGQKGSKPSPPAIVTLEEKEFPTFEEYLLIFQKTYGPEEKKRRQTIYNERILELKRQKLDPEITYAVGVTKFTDKTHEQLENGKHLEIDSKSKLSYTKKPARLAQSKGVPSSLDWRDAGVVTSIKDQGDCGACWTFATTAYGESRLILNKTHTKDINLSEQFLLSCTSDCSCSGGYLEYVFEKAAGGIPLDSDYPYSPFLPVSPFICWTGRKVQIGYIPQKMYDLTDSQLKDLLQKGPVAISVSATNWQDYKGGVFKCKSFDKVNHAVLLVGYTPNQWIIKNQWGTKWGENGYIRITMNRLNNCKIGTSAFIMWQPLSVCSLFVMILVMLVSI